MKSILFLVMVAFTICIANANQKQVHAIHASADRSIAYWTDGDFKDSVISKISDLSIEDQTTWQQALVWFISNTLKSGEVIAGDLILEIQKNGVVLTQDTIEASEPVTTVIGYRNLIIAYVPIANAAGNRTTRRVTSEDISDTDLRDRLLALIESREEAINEQ